MADLDIDVPDAITASLSSVLDYLTATATSSALPAAATLINSTLTDPGSDGLDVLEQGINQGNPVVCPLPSEEWNGAHSFPDR